jgi:aconitate hydratase
MTKSQNSTSQANSYSTLSELTVDGETYQYHSLPALGKKLGVAIEKLPYSIQILLENLLRQEDGDIVKKADIETLANWDPKTATDYEIQFMPARVLLQDFTGVPVIADLAAMRSAMRAKGGDPARVNPLQPVDLVIDHSVQVDSYGSKDSLKANSVLEFERNRERYEFLKWGQQAFENFQVVPPATGICHQVNLEYLSSVALVAKKAGVSWIYPDSLVGTDSHTPMINGLGVLGWGVGGIEAEAAMLGQPCSMLIPQVVGFELTGRLPVGATATDLVLTVTQMLRKKGVVGKFVEFFGDGLANLSIADRATIGNMAPEYGATVGLFPVGKQTIDYLNLTGRSAKARRTESYFKAQGLWFDEERARLVFSDTLHLNLQDVVPSVAGPSRPHDRSPLGKARTSFRGFLATHLKDQLAEVSPEAVSRWVSEGGPYLAPVELASAHPDLSLGDIAKQIQVKDPSGQTYRLSQGSIVIAAITSCTNTSNPDLMIGAAVLARNALKAGLMVKPWVKTSFAPGSKVVSDYIQDAGLMGAMDALRFNLVGYGCTTCIGNSGPLPQHISEAIDTGGLATVSVLSGNRNFEARINPQVLANYLMSPPLVVAYALAGNINADLTQDPLGQDSAGKAVYLKDIWPDAKEVHDLVAKFVTKAKFEKNYGNVFLGEAEWQSTQVPTGKTYDWKADSSYIKEPPFFSEDEADWLQGSIQGARALGVFGDFITTDHISPAGSIGKNSPAGLYLQKNQIAYADFNSYGARRGNHEVMMRGTFANVRIRNKMMDGAEGGLTKHQPDGASLSIYDAAMLYKKEKTPLIILAGKEYGSGSSRDWAAKGTRLLGVKAVIAQSFERIHRSNLVGMGVLPLQFKAGESMDTYKLDGSESFAIPALAELAPKRDVTVLVTRKDGSQLSFKVTARIDTPNELRYYRKGGILPFVLEKLM